jgi:hypothetical protein
VDDRVKRSSSKPKTNDYAVRRERSQIGYGVKPGKIVDYLSLIGIPATSAGGGGIDRWAVKLLPIWDD